MTKLWSISPEEHFEENNVVQNKNSLVFFKFWGKKRSDIAEIILASLNKLHVKSPRNYFSSHFLMFDYPFCQFPTFSRSFLESLSKLLSSSAKDRFERRKVLSNKEEFFQSFSKEFRILSKKNYISGKQNQQECQTSVQLAQKNNLRKTMLKRKTFLYLFQTLIEKRWEVAQKNLVTFSKLKLTYPVE